MNLVETEERAENNYRQENSKMRMTSNALSFFQNEKREMWKKDIQTCDSFCCQVKKAAAAASGLDIALICVQSKE